MVFLIPPQVINHRKKLGPASALNRDGPFYYLKLWLKTTLSMMD